MKHHFADILDRKSDYWTIVPNRQRFMYSGDEIIVNKDDVRILTINKHHENWRQIFDCVNIEELTLHDPSKEQVLSIQKLTQIKRLRITFFRTKDIDFISKLQNL